MHIMPKGVGLWLLNHILPKLLFAWRGLRAEALELGLLTNMTELGKMDWNP